MIPHISQKQKLTRCTQQLYSLMQDNNAVLKEIPFENLTGTVSRKSPYRPHIRAAMICYLYNLLEEKIQPPVFGQVFNMDRSTIQNILKLHEQRMLKKRFRVYQHYYNDMPEKSICIEYQAFKQIRRSIQPKVYRKVPYLPTKNQPRSNIILDEHKEKAEEIMIGIAKKLNTAPEAIKTTKNKKEFVVARTAFIVTIMNLYPQLSLEAVARLLEYPYHSIVITSIQTYRDMFDPKNRTPFALWYQNLVLSLIKIPRSFKGAA